jgi:hypothetical protein
VHAPDPARTLRRLVLAVWITGILSVALDFALESTIPEPIRAFRQAEFERDPTAAELVGTVLFLAAHERRNGFVEPERRPAAQRGEGAAVQLEGDRGLCAGRHRHSFGVVRDLRDPRVGRNVHRVVDHLLGVVVEPEKRRDLVSGEDLPPGIRTDRIRAGAEEPRPASGEVVVRIYRSFSS